MLRPGKNKKRNDKDNPGREYVTRSFCDERFQRVLDKLITIEKKVDELKDEKREESHALRNAIVSLVVGAVLALLGYALGKM